MSRCFPFPPPGYDNKLGDHGELLAKEKHKEKKHKKEKKDKEKKEGKKDKKEKDRSKDKHKEKKDRKEKHKDKKKEKDRDKTKNRTSDEGRIEGQASAHNEGKLGDNSRKAEEIKDSKYMEELGRRIRDEEKGATIRMVDTTGSIQKGIENIVSEIAISNSIHRRAEGMEIGAAVNDAIKKRMDSMATGTTAIGGTGQKGFENMRTGNANINSLQRRPEIMGTDAAVSGSVKRRIENTGTGLAISGMQDPIESINTQTAVFQKNTESKSAGTAISGSLQKRMDSKGIGIAITSSGPNRTQSMVDSMAMEKERSTVSKLVPNLVGTEERKKNGMGRQVETDAEKRIEIDKERVTGNKMLTNLIRMENRKNNGLGKQVESIMEKRSETNDKAKEREPGRHKEKNREEKKSKRKDKSRHKEKEKETEKMREKGELGNKDKLKNTGKKDLVDNLSFKPAVPHIDTENNTVPDVTVKKRKDFETNGALHENDVRPHKLPRLASSSHLPVENGRTAELNHLITPNSFMRQRGFNSVNVKAERALDIQDRKANGIKEAHTSEVEMKSLSASATANGEVSAKPHPDTKFLTKVYSVPKMDEWPEYDDQEWLFINNNNQQKPRPTLEVEEIPQVWAEAVRIKSADVFAMPYVVPY